MTVSLPIICQQDWMHKRVVLHVVSNDAGQWSPLPPLAQMSSSQRCKEPVAGKSPVVCQQEGMHQGVVVCTVPRDAGQ